VDLLCADNRSFGPLEFRWVEDERMGLGATHPPMGAHQLLEGCHFVQLRPKGAVEDYVGAVVETVGP
jgi:hypothetical protein